MTVSLDLVLRLVEIGATLAFAAAGSIEALRKRMDVVGVMAAAFLTAFGGGTVRDILLDRRPFFWVAHHEYVWLVLGLALVSMALLTSRRVPLTERAIRIPDALGLGLFSASGVSQALDAGMPQIVAVLMGVITGVFGGVLRDVICNEIPVVFRDHRPYALCAFAGCWLFVALHAAGTQPLVSVLAAAITVATLRLLALAFDWRVPAWPGT